MIPLTQWLYFIFVPALASFVGVVTYDRSRNMWLSILAGAFIAAAFQLGISAVFWDRVDPCEYCVAEGEAG